MLNIYEKFKDRTFNPLKLRPAETGLTNLEIYYSRKHFLENIWGRTVYQKPNYNSLSNILWIFALFSSYFLKYESSRCLILVECELVNIREKGGEMQSFPICAVVLYVQRNLLICFYRTFHPSKCSLHFKCGLDEPTPWNLRVTYLRLAVYS